MDEVLAVGIQTDAIEDGRRLVPLSHGARIAVQEAMLRLQVKHLLELMEEKFKSIEKERSDWFVETQRRLHELNGHNDETRKNLEITVSRDRFQGLIDGDIASLKSSRDKQDSRNIDLDKWQGEVRGDLKVFTLFMGNINGRIAMMVAAGSMLGGGGMAALIAWLKGP